MSFKDTCAADFHIHVNFSRDSIISPKNLVKIARKRAISVVAVTDHNCFEGAQLTLKEAKDTNAALMVVTGMEISSDHGHVIALFIQEKIRSKNYNEILDEVDNQDGLVVIPHPCKKSQKFTRKEYAKADLLEGLNGRATTTENESAIKLANSLCMSAIAGSDSHMPFELGRVRTLLPWRPNSTDELKKMLLKRKMVRTEIKVDSFSPYATHLLSFSIENCRRLFKYAK